MEPLNFNGDDPAVHQATGMVSLQLGVDVVEARHRLRSYAAEVHRPLSDVAGDIVARRVQLGPGASPDAQD